MLITGAKAGCYFQLKKKKAFSYSSFAEGQRIGLVRRSARDLQAYAEFGACNDDDRAPPSVSFGPGLSQMIDMKDYLHYSAPP